MGAQITLIGVPGPMSIEAVLSAPNGGYGSSSGGRGQSRSVMPGGGWYGKLTGQNRR